MAENNGNLKYQYSGPRGISFQIVKSYPNLRELVNDFNNFDSCPVNYGEYAIIDAGLLTDNNIDYIQDIDSTTDPVLFAKQCELHQTFGDNGKIFQRIRPTMVSYYYSNEDNYSRKRDNLVSYAGHEKYDTDTLAIPIAKGSGDNVADVAPHVRYIARIQGPMISDSAVNGDQVYVTGNDGTGVSLQQALNEKSNVGHTHSSDSIFYNGDSVSTILGDLQTEMGSVSELLDLINRKTNYD